MSDGWREDGGEPLYDDAAAPQGMPGASTPGAGGAPPPGGGVSDAARRSRDLLVALGILAVLLFNAPVLRAFGSGASLFGWPLLYIYIFAAWGIVIWLAAIAIERRGSR